MPPPASPPSRKLTRSHQERLLAGVAGGIAAHLHVPPVLLRIAFLLLLAFNGLGALLYAVFWAVLPTDPAEPKARRELLRLLPFLLIGLGVMIVGIAVNSDSTTSGIGWLVALIAVGGGILWHQSDPDRPDLPADTAGRGGVTKSWHRMLAGDRNRRGYLLRFVGGTVLAGVGVIGSAAVYAPSGITFADLGLALASALVALLGVAAVAGPVLWRMLSALRVEREGRVREQERAELAAMVHDQVLHTLALIQRNAGDPASVQRLARGQERSLRNWLYQPAGSPDEHFAAALQLACAEVEDTFGIEVESVIVGDRVVDDRVAALVAAAREALVNAARHAGVPNVSLYAEAEPGQLSVFVRDRGAGFDTAILDSPETELRHGVRGSIIGRMIRHGGRAEVRSEPGDGTEVRLAMPVASTSQAGR